MAEHTNGNGEKKKFAEWIAGEKATALVRLMQFAWPILFAVSVWAGGEIVRLNAERIMGAISDLNTVVKEMKTEMKAMQATDFQLQMQVQRNSDAIANMREPR